MIQGIGHIGVFVASIENSLAALAKLADFTPPVISESRETGMRCAVVSLGATQLELLQEINPEGGLAKHCREKGDFIHHFALLTDDSQSDLKKIREKGVEMQDQEPRIGLRRKLIAMSTPKAFNGISVELSEP